MATRLPFSAVGDLFFWFPYTIALFIVYFFCAQVAPHGIPVSTVFFGHDPSIKNYKDAVKIKNIDMHPINPWVVSADVNGHISVWDYDNKSVVCAFSASTLKDVQRINVDTVATQSTIVSQSDAGLVPDIYAPGIGLGATDSPETTFGSVSDVYLNERLSGQTRRKNMISEDIKSARTGSVRGVYFADRHTLAGLGYSRGDYDGTDVHGNIASPPNLGDVSLCSSSREVANMFSYTSEDASTGISDSTLVTHDWIIVIYEYRIVLYDYANNSAIEMPHSALQVEFSGPIGVLGHSSQSTVTINKSRINVLTAALIGPGVIAFGCDDGAVRIWCSSVNAVIQTTRLPQASGNKAITHLQTYSTAGHLSGVSNMKALSPATALGAAIRESRVYLAAGAVDGTIHSWEVLNGRMIADSGKRWILSCRIGGSREELAGLEISFDTLLGIALGSDYSVTLIDFQPHTRQGTQTSQNALPTITSRHSNSSTAAEGGAGGHYVSAVSIGSHPYFPPCTTLAAGKGPHLELIIPGARGPSYSSQVESGVIIYDLRSARPNLPTKLKTYVMKKHPWRPDLVAIGSNVGLHVVSIAPAYTTSPLVVTHPLWSIPAYSTEESHTLDGERVAEGKVVVHITADGKLVASECIVTSAATDEDGLSGLGLNTAGKTAEGLLIPAPGVTYASTAAVGLHIERKNHVLLPLVQPHLTPQTSIGAPSGSNPPPHDAIHSLYTWLKPGFTPPGGRGAKLRLSSSGRYLGIIWPEYRCYAIYKLVMPILGSDPLSDVEMEIYRGLEMEYNHDVDALSPARTTSSANIHPASARSNFSRLVKNTSGQGTANKQADDESIENVAIYEENMPVQAPEASDDEDAKVGDRAESPSAQEKETSVDDQLDLPALGITSQLSDGIHHASDNETASQHSVDVTSDVSSTAEQDVASPSARRQVLQASPGTHPYMGHDASASMRSHSHRGFHPLFSRTGLFRHGDSKNVWSAEFVESGVGIDIAWVGPNTTNIIDDFTAIEAKAFGQYSFNFREMQANTNAAGESTDPATTDNAHKFLSERYVVLLPGKVHTGRGPIGGGMAIGQMPTNVGKAKQKTSLSQASLLVVTTTPCTLSLRSLPLPSDIAVAVEPVTLVPELALPQEPVAVWGGGPLLAIAFAPEQSSQNPVSLTTASLGMVLQSSSLAFFSWVAKQPIDTGAQEDPATKKDTRYSGIASSTVKKPSLVPISASRLNIPAPSLSGALSGTGVAWSEDLQTVAITTPFGLKALTFTMPKRKKTLEGRKLVYDIQDKSSSYLTAVEILDVPYSPSFVLWNRGMIFAQISTELTALDAPMLPRPINFHNEDKVIAIFPPILDTSFLTPEALNSGLPLHDILLSRNGVKLQPVVVELQTARPSISFPINVVPSPMPLPRRGMRFPWGFHLTFVARNHLLSFQWQGVKCAGAFLSKGRALFTTTNAAKELHSFSTSGKLISYPFIGADLHPLSVAHSALNSMLAITSASIGNSPAPATIYVHATSSASKWGSLLPTSAQSGLAHYLSSLGADTAAMMLSHLPLRTRINLALKQKHALNSSNFHGIAAIDCLVAISVLRHVLRTATNAEIVSLGSPRASCTMDALSYGMNFILPDAVLNLKELRYQSSSFPRIKNIGTLQPNVSCSGVSLSSGELGVWAQVGSFLSLAASVLPIELLPVASKPSNPGSSIESDERASIRHELLSFSRRLSALGLSSDAVSLASTLYSYHEPMKTLDSAITWLAHPLLTDLMFDHLNF